MAHPNDRSPPQNKHQNPQEPNSIGYISASVRESTETIDAVLAVSRDCIDPDRNQ